MGIILFKFKNISLHQKKQKQNFMLSNACVNFLKKENSSVGGGSSCRFETQQELKQSDFVADVTNGGGH